MRCLLSYNPYYASLSLIDLLHILTPWSSITSTYIHHHSPSSFLNTFHYSFFNTHHSILSIFSLFLFSLHPLLTHHSSLFSPHSSLNTPHSPFSILSITGTLTYPRDGSEKGPVIVFVHGTMSSKDHNFVPDVCKKMIADYGENAWSWIFLCCVVHELWSVNYYSLCSLHSSLFLILSFSFLMIYNLFFVLCSLFSTTFTPFESWK